jgi:hypothetical protein
MYQKEITTHEYVYNEQEQERLNEIQIELNRLISNVSLSTSEFKKLVDEMGDIISGVWSAPMPF